MSENHYRCYCGGIIIADTEDWEQPLCHKHYCEFLGSYQQKLNSAIEVIEFYGNKSNWTHGQRYIPEYCFIRKDGQLTTLNDEAILLGGKKARNWLKENK